MSRYKIIKPWRSCFRIDYSGTDALLKWREPILAILCNAAFVKGIDFAVLCGNGGWLTGHSAIDKISQDIEPDFVHFRSGKIPIISRVDFEKSLMALMPGPPLDLVEVGPMFQYALKNIPFPEVSDAQPLLYGIY